MMSNNDKLKLSKYTGEFPIRTGIIVLPADNPNRKLIGWKWEEHKGEMYLVGPKRFQRLRNWLRALIFWKCDPNW